MSAVSDVTGGMVSAAAGWRMWTLFGMWFASGTLPLFDVDSARISRLKVSAPLWHLLWYVTQACSQNRRPATCAAICCG